MEEIPEFYSYIIFPTFLNLRINQLITFFFIFYRYVIRKQREENAKCIVYLKNMGTLMYIEVVHSSGCR